MASLRGFLLNKVAQGVGGLVFGKDGGNNQEEVDSVVESLLERVSNGSASADRRSALSDLRDILSENDKAQNALGAMGLPVLISVLREERSDTELIKSCLEALIAGLNAPPELSQNGNSVHMFHSQNGNSVTTVHPAILNCEMFSREKGSVSLLVSLLEENDFYIRYHCTQLLNLLMAQCPKKLQDEVLAVPQGVGRILDLVAERELIRNEALVLLISLTRSAKDIKQIIVFEGGVERLLSLVNEEGGWEGGVVVQDCIDLLSNLLLHSPQNQEIVRETVGLSRLSETLINSAPREAEGRGEETREGEREKKRKRERVPLNSRQKVCNLLSSLDFFRALLTPPGKAREDEREGEKAGGEREEEGVRESFHRPMKIQDSNVATNQNQLARVPGFLDKLIDLSDPECMERWEVRKKALEVLSLFISLNASNKLVVAKRKVKKRVAHQSSEFMSLLSLSSSLALPFDSPLFSTEKAGKKKGKKFPFSLSSTLGFARGKESNVDQSGAKKYDVERERAGEAGGGEGGGAVEEGENERERAEKVIQALDEKEAKKNQKVSNYGKVGDEDYDSDLLKVEIEFGGEEGESGRREGEGERAGEEENFVVFEPFLSLVLRTALFSAQEPESYAGLKLLFEFCEGNPRAQSLLLSSLLLSSERESGRYDENRRQGNALPYGENHFGRNEGRTMSDANEREMNARGVLPTFGDILLSALSSSLPLLSSLSPPLSHSKSGIKAEGQGSVPQELSARCTVVLHALLSYNLEEKDKLLQLRISSLSPSHVPSTGNSLGSPFTSLSFPPSLPPPSSLALSLPPSPSLPPFSLLEWTVAALSSLSNHLVSHYKILTNRMQGANDNLLAGNLSAGNIYPQGSSQGSNYTQVGNHHPSSLYFGSRDCSQPSSLSSLSPSFPFSLPPTEFASFLSSFLSLHFHLSLFLHFFVSLLFNSPPLVAAFLASPSNLPLLLDLSSTLQLLSASPGASLDVGEEGGREGGREGVAILQSPAVLSVANHLSGLCAVLLGCCVVFNKPTQNPLSQTKGPPKGTFSSQSTTSLAVGGGGPLASFGLGASKNSNVDALTVLDVITNRIGLANLFKIIEQMGRGRVVASASKRGGREEKERRKSGREGEREGGEEGSNVREEEEEEGVTQGEEGVGRREREDGFSGEREGGNGGGERGSERGSAASLLASRKEAKGRANELREERERCVRELLYFRNDEENGREIFCSNVYFRLLVLVFADDFFYLNIPRFEQELRDGVLKLYSRPLSTSPSFSQGVEAGGERVDKRVWERRAGESESEFAKRLRDMVERQRNEIRDLQERNTSLVFQLVSKEEKAGPSVQLSPQIVAAIKRELNPLKQAGPPAGQASSAGDTSLVGPSTEGAVSSGGPNRTLVENSLREEINSLLRRIEDLQLELRQAKEERGDLVAKVSVMESEYSESQEASAKLEQEVHALSLAYHSLEEDSLRLERELQEKTEKLNKCEKQLQEERAARAALATISGSEKGELRDSAQSKGEEERSGESDGYVSREEELAAAREEGRAEGVSESEAEMNDLLICLGQEENKVERLRTRLMQLGEDVDKLLEDLSGGDEEGEGVEEGG